MTPPAQPDAVTLAAILKAVDEFGHACYDVGDKQEGYVTKNAAQAALLTAFRSLVQERDEARRFGEQAAQKYNELLAEGRTLRCAFCNAVYPPGTPASQHELLTAHILSCEKHPLHQRAERDLQDFKDWDVRLIAAERERDRLKGIVGEYEEDSAKRLGKWFQADDQLAKAVERAEAAERERDEEVFALAAKLGFTEHLWKAAEARLAADETARGLLERVRKAAKPTKELQADIDASPAAPPAERLRELLKESRRLLAIEYDGHGSPHGHREAGGLCGTCDALRKAVSDIDAVLTEPRAE